MRFLIGKTSADCSQPTVDLLGEDIERGPTGYADGINVGFAFAVRRERRSLGLQQRGLPLLQPGKLAAARRRTCLLTRPVGTNRAELGLTGRSCAWTAIAPARQITPIDNTNLSKRLHA